MAWNEIKAACGHTYQVQLYGPMKGREREVASREQQECPDCYKTRIEAERAAKTEAAKAANAELPALTGSPKQIAWAETLRATGVAQLQALLAKLDAVTPEAAVGKESTFAKAREIIANRMAKTDSKYWIDNRNGAFDSAWLSKVVAKAMEEIKL